MERQKFELTQVRFGHKAGTVVYEWTGHDYGCARDDTMATNKPHRSVSLVNGEHPFFTVPNEHLKAIA